LFKPVSLKTSTCQLKTPGLTFSETTNNLHPGKTLKKSVLIIERERPGALIFTAYNVIKKTEILDLFLARK